jgi:2-polyprenyl-3-methyl-5-hydroxy-6-metoxy-1,4-benzoquinol methylase
MNETPNYCSSDRVDIAFYISSNIKSILDIGCGQGSFLKLIKEQTEAKTCGIEVTPEIAEKAKEQADNILTGKVKDLLGLLPNGYFDCITFNNTLDHLLDSAEVLKQIKPKLSKNGIIITSIPNVKYFTNLYEMFIKKDCENKDSGILDSTHLRFFTKKSMNECFKMLDI